MHKLILLIFALALTSGCATSKKLGADVEAYDETLHLVKKLQKRPGKEKLWMELTQTYPSAIQWFDSIIVSGASNEQAKMKWVNTYSQMMRVNAMTDSVMTIPGWDSHITDLRTYTENLDSIKVLAADECISQAQFLNKYNNKATLRIAVFYLDKAEELAPEHAEIGKLRTEIVDKLSAKQQKD